MASGFPDFYSSLKLESDFNSSFEPAGFKEDHLLLVVIIPQTKKSKFINRNQTNGKYYQIFLLQKRVSWIMEYHQLTVQDQTSEK